jgi:hypothetical protein
MLYMVIEHFNDAEAVYQRARERGRMLPDGLEYLGSWVEPNRVRCFQLMQCEDAKLLEAWASQWHDLVEFEFVPVVTGAEMAKIMNPQPPTAA